jgi:hypothetical protein
LDWPSFIDLCHSYFDRDPSISPFKITYETSGIVDLALHAKAANPNDADAGLAQFERALVNQHLSSA